MAKTKKTKHKQRNQELLKSQIKTVKSELIDGVLTYSSSLTVSALAEILKCRISDIVKIFFLRGQIINVGTLLDDEQIEIICESFDYLINKVKEISKANFIESVKIVEHDDVLHNRPPVITIMGHVDHGKTTLLDTIRKSKVAASESGGITQHIGAYQIEYNKNLITFIDTPGHAAFTNMRARGASVTDIVVIVVAADDGLKLQTKEAIDHARAASVPIIVFINKTDKPAADIERTISTVSDYGLMPEEWGGDTIYTSGSALNNEGIDKLLDNILLVAEMCELRANKNTFATGIVLESHLDKGRGPVATLIVKNGTLKIKDFIVLGGVYGRIRNLYDATGKQLKIALPSTPVIVTGLSDVPHVGNKFMVFEDAKFGKTLANERKDQNRFLEQRKDSNAISLMDISNEHSDSGSGIKTLNLIIKSDTSGTGEALAQTIQKISVSNFKIKILRSSVGSITDSDVILAKASQAIIYGFNVRPMSSITKLAQKEKVEIRLHTIIYKVIEEIEEALKGMLEPEFQEKVLGQAEVRAIFKFSKIGTIAGCKVSSGLIKRGADIRVLRDGVIIYDGEIGSLKFEKNDIKSAPVGKECGITIKRFNDIKVGDILEAYVEEEVLVNE